MKLKALLFDLIKDMMAQENKNIEFMHDFITQKYQYILYIMPLFWKTIFTL